MNETNLKYNLKNEADETISDEVLAFINEVADVYIENVDLK